AVGPAHVREAGTLDVPEYTVAKKDLSAEAKRLTAGVILARRQIKRLRDTAAKDLAAEDMHYLFDAYLHMLGDDSRLVRGALARMAETRMNAEAAVQAQLNDLVHAFQAMDNAYIAA